MPGARAPGSGREPSHQERTAPAEESQQKLSGAERQRSCNEVATEKKRRDHVPARREAKRATRGTREEFRACASPNDREPRRAMSRTSARQRAKRQGEAERPRSGFRPEGQPRLGAPRQPERSGHNRTEPQKNQPSGGITEAPNRPTYER